MRKYILAAAFAALLITGCAAQNPSAEANTPTEESGAGETTIYAEVSDVISNQLSIKLLRGSFDPEAMAERFSQTDGQGSGGAGRERPSGAPSEGFFFSGGGTGEMPSGDPDRAEWSGEMPSGAPDRAEWSGEMPSGAPDRGSWTGEPPSGDPAASRYTGEERDVIVPIGTPISSVSFTDGSLTESPAELADIKNGSTVNIALSAEGIVREVRIINMNIGRRVTGGTSGIPEGGFEGGFTPPEGTQIFINPDGGDAAFYRAPDAQ
ncbi:MAG: hypothetical protein LBK41_02725 [Clostridiales bacterium]|jgi:hypothetical protein|nr:hypothetical protein [Clostridiales bacterium]